MTTHVFRSRCVVASIWGASLLFSLTANAQVPEWIWHNHQGALPPAKETVFARKQFEVARAVQRAELKVCGDDEATVFLNGRQIVVARAKSDPKSARYSATALDVTGNLSAGRNLIAAQLRNSGGPFGVIVKLEITLADGRTQTLISDASWQTMAEKVEGWEKPEFRAAGWTPALSVAKEGDNPWFEVMTPPTTARELKLPPGFQSELLREARPGEGSWIAMTIDDRGRLIVSPQMLVSSNYGGLLRFTLGADGRIVKGEKINLPIGGAQGLVYAHGSLYVDGYSGTYTPDKLGFYRVRDTDGDDQFDKVEMLAQLYNRGGSHGPHGLALGPDGMIYHVSGDYARPVDGVSPNSPHKNFKEDLLQPRIWDPSGHARGVMAPCGTIQRTDKDGKKWELVAAGFRNPYDLAFNADGELFTYDADMEYDVGLPWYRPTRVYNVVSGGEYGQRAGSSKWPYYYHDSLPPATDIGLGSPCGLKFGTNSKFPPKYQKALFLCDWAWGHVYAVHLQPRGAGYAATFESFASGRPLNAMDIEFGTDGAMYFITGGNDTRTGLYRISYAGSPVGAPRPTAAEVKREQAAAAARALRHKLESFHGRKDPAAVEFAWPHLDSEDRWIRYAARIAIEWQDPLLWQSRALTEKRPRAALTALLALARVGKPEVKHDLLNSLLDISPANLGEAQQLELLRDFGVVFTRLGGPSPELRQKIAKRLDPLYPAKSDALNRELCQLLVFLEAPSVVGKSLALLAGAKTQEQQIYYIHCLRNVRYGWTLPQRETYFQWFTDTAPRYRGGVSFYQFLALIKKDAIATVPAAERPQLAEYLKDFETALKVNTVAPRPFVKEWKLEELLPDLARADSGRSFAKGKAAFEAAQCILCHRFGQDGGVVGPDLTGVASRFSRRDILESILNPSKIVMEQYRNTTIIKTDGSSESGRLMDEDDQKVVLITNPLTLERLEIPKKEIKGRRASELSPMPEGLVNVLKQEEILDLLAWLESGGSANYAAFRKAK